MTQPAAPTAADRILRAFRALVRGEDPNRTFAGGPWEYQVQRADGSTFDGSPTEQALPLPPLVNVPYRGSIAGSTCNPTPGTLAYVCFANGDPTKPILVAFGPTLPLSTTIDSAAGSTITIGATSAVVNAGGSGAAPLALASPIVTWAALVVTSVNQIATYINAIAPGTVTPLVALANPATTKVIGK